VSENLKKEGKQKAGWGGNRTGNKEKKTNRGVVQGGSATLKGKKKSQVTVRRQK